MNAAEITDKLGLHSLRQRAWVCLALSLIHFSLALKPPGLITRQLTVPLVHPIHLRYLR